MSFRSSLSTASSRSSREVASSSTSSGPGPVVSGARRSHRSSRIRAMSRRWSMVMPSPLARRIVRARPSSASRTSWSSSHRSAKARWLVTSSRRSKPGGRPASRGFSASRRRANPWTVESEARSTSFSAASARERRWGSVSSRVMSSSALRNRSPSSAAARSVKVMAAIPSMATPSSTTRATIRSIREVVLPVPAPAWTKRLSSKAAAMRSRAAWSPGVESWGANRRPLRTRRSA